MSNSIDMTFEYVHPVRGMIEIAGLRNIIRGKAYIAGGYARYVVSPLPDDQLAKPEDVDIFSRSTEAFESLVADFDKLGFKRANENDLAITFDTGRSEYPKVQLIKPFMKDAVCDNLKDLLLRFDFSVTMVGITDDGSVMVHYCFMDDEINKRLRLLNIHCPVSSVRRFCKYAKKGYKFTMQEVAKLFVEYEKRPQSFKDNVHRLASFVPAHLDTQEQKEEIRNIYKEMFID